MLDGGTNCGKGGQLWQPFMVRRTIGGAVFGPVGPLATWTTSGVTDQLYFAAVVQARLAGRTA